eukprot:COSAG06_NODE_25840_length_627_cov_1.850379_1_plen_59_part_10
MQNECMRASSSWEDAHHIAHSDTLTHLDRLLAGGGTARELPCWYGSRLVQGAAVARQLD